ncbi:uro-adherence factor A-like [Procambarus clarkii]|uniref:uro-adherence factor A-like n=1 Tax=Procambarus clarkii TaxID=6728 RepID=UPI003742DD51
MVANQKYDQVKDIIESYRNILLVRDTDPGKLSLIESELAKYEDKIQAKLDHYYKVLATQNVPNGFFFSIGLSLANDTPSSSTDVKDYLTESDQLSESSSLYYLDSINSIHEATELTSFSQEPREMSETVDETTSEAATDSESETEDVESTEAATAAEAGIETATAVETLSRASADNENTAINLVHQLLDSSQPDQSVDSLQAFSFQLESLLSSFSKEVDHPTAEWMTKIILQRKLSESEPLSESSPLYSLDSIYAIHEATELTSLPHEPRKPSEAADETVSEAATISESETEDEEAAEAGIKAEAKQEALSKISDGHNHSHQPPRGDTEPISINQAIQLPKASADNEKTIINIVHQLLDLSQPD